MATRDLRSLLVKNPIACSIAVNVVTVNSTDIFLMFVSPGKVPRKSSTSEKIGMRLSKPSRTWFRTLAACLAAWVIAASQSCALALSWVLLAMFSNNYILHLGELPPRPTPVSSMDCLEQYQMQSEPPQLGERHCQQLSV